MATVSEALAQANQYLQAGQYAYAEQLLRQVVAAAPANADAWRRLALAVQSLGRADEAINYFQHSIQCQPDYVEAYNDLGIAYANTGRLEEAVRVFRQAFERVPANVDAANNLGVILGMLGRPQEGIGYVEQAVKAQPDNPGFLSNFGNLLRDVGKLDEAVASYRRSLQINPSSAQTFNGLGNALREQGKLAEAVAQYRQSLRLYPNYFKAHHGLGAALVEMGNVEEAETHYREALRIQPQQAETHFLLGVALTRQARFEQALGSFQQALYLKPNFPEAYNSQGNMFLEQARHDEAAASYQRALELRPGFAEAHNNLANALADQGKLDAALAEYREAIKLDPRYVDAHSNLLMHLNYHPGIDPETIFAEHKRWDEMHGHKGPAKPHDNVADPKRRLRVGYVTPDLNRHPVAKFFVEPVLAHHDAGQVETICYAEVPHSQSARVRGLASAWRAIRGLTDAEVAAQIRADHIDILVDLAGHTVNNRLRVFTHKPAPVQITCLGYPNTTGLAAMDYRLTDAIADPPGEPIRHTEELVRLGGAFCCYAPPDKELPLAALPARQNGHVTFGSPHHLAKINDAVLDLWCAILRELPTARLLVFRHTLKGKLQDDMRRRFAERGIGPEQVTLQTATDVTRGFLGWYGSVDITLDAFPWSSHTTACDALWMGVPILTLAGTTHVARMGASVLTHLNLPELVAHSPDDYLHKAVELAGDVDKLEHFRKHLRQQLLTSPLCDGGAFTRGLESTYRQLWQRWCTGPRSHH
jgi:predicted O-linked N-acetylglucosamine transferase (SPINDLY family)